MKGKVTIKVSNMHESFYIELTRKVTVLRGDSGIGKSVFHKLVRDYYVTPSARKSIKLEYSGCSGITFPSDIEKNWYDTLSKHPNAVVFIDENNYNVLRDGDFGKKVKNSDNYFLIICRRKLHIEDDEDYEDVADIGYSVGGVLTLEGRAKNGFMLNKAVPLYPKAVVNIKPDIVLVEGRKFDYNFFSRTLTMEVIPAKGRDNVVKRLFKMSKTTRDKIIYVVVDNENFGYNIGKLVELVESESFAERNIDVYVSSTPSFEYLLLSTNKVFLENMSHILSNTQDYCDVSVYNNWEKFYTDIMEKGYILDKDGEDVIMSKIFTRVNNMHYSKGSFNNAYLSSDIIDSVYSLLGDLNFSCVKDLKGV